MTGPSKVQYSAQDPEPLAMQSCAGRTRPTGFALIPELPVQFRQWLMLTVLAAISCLLINHFVFQIVQVRGRSMLPTLHDSDRYFLNRLVYVLHSPRRGDVVVLKDPSDGGYAVKRVIAGAGDAVYLKGGRVYVNGRQLVEPYLLPGTRTGTCSKVPEELIVCGINQFFVMGDNRCDSYDSRMYGPVPRRNILGAIVH
jgi:signal peptidase I